MSKDKELEESNNKKMQILIDRGVPIHIMPVENSDIIEHEELESCPCNPLKIFEIDMKVPDYIHNKLKDNPQ